MIHIFNIERQLLLLVQSVVLEALKVSLGQVQPCRRRYLMTNRTVHGFHLLANCWGTTKPSAKYSGIRQC